MSFIRKIFSIQYYQKILSSFLIIFLIFSTIFVLIPAKKANAQFIVHDPIATVFHAIVAGSAPITAAGTGVSASNSTAFNLKVFLLDGIATALARGIVQQLTAQTVNWINTGFNGNPAYVTDPAQFFENVSDQAVMSQLNGSLLKNICSPFSPQIRLALVQQYMNQNQLGSCSIQSIVNNYSSWTQNFENGGWNSWFMVTQNMTGNPYGAYIAAQDQLNISVSNQNETYKTQLAQGNGFLSYQTCKSGQHIVSASNPNDAGNIDGGTATPGLCSDGSKPTVATPGSVIHDQLGKSLGSTWDELNLTNSINQIVSALMTQGIKGIFGGIQDGLRGLSESGQNNNASLVSQLMVGSSASGADASSTLASIYSNVPSSLTSSIGASTNGFLPSIDQTAVQNQIDQEAATFQEQGTITGNNANTTDNPSTGISTGGTCLYPSTNTTDSTVTQTQCTTAGGTWAPSSGAGSTGTNTNTTSSTDIGGTCTYPTYTTYSSQSQCTGANGTWTPGGSDTTTGTVPTNTNPPPVSCTSSTSNTPNVVSTQGYNASTTSYSDYPTAGQYMVVYGTGFDPNCDVVTLGGQNYTPTYTSSTQLNVLLRPDISGWQVLQVSTGSVQSSAVQVDIISANSNTTGGTSTNNPPLYCGDGVCLVQ